MVRVQHEFARHNDQSTALDVVGFPYSEYHERGRIEDVVDASATGGAKT